MPRKPSDITRVVNGRTERLCKTSECGWHPCTPKHFPHSIRRGKDAWGIYCLPCNRAIISQRWRDQRDAGMFKTTTVEAAPVSPTPPPLTWARLLP